jgi:acetyltransferase
MERFFRPRSVAVVGASQAPDNLGATICRGLRDYFGFSGQVYAVNRRAEPVHGCAGFASVLDIPGPVDLAVVLVPAALVPDVVEACGRKGVGAVVVESSGFLEAGEAGRGLQAALEEVAARHGVRVMGPNCLGTLDARHRFSCLYGVGPEMRGALAAHFERPGAVSYVIQSGGVGVLLLESMGADPAGVSRVASIGNASDVDESDLLAFLDHDDDTRVIGLYLENVTRGRKFLEAARAARKPVLVYKSGRTRDGARAATSHTAGLANNDAVFDGVCAQAGVTRLRSVTELHALPKAFTQMPPLRGPRVAVFTNSGAFGTMGADLVAGTTRLRMASLSVPSRARLRALGGVYNADNPVDLGPSPPATYLEIFRVLLEDPEVDAILCLASIWRDFVIEVDNELVGMCHAHGKPAALYAPNATEKVVAVRRAHGLPLFESPEEAVRALEVSLAHHRARSRSRRPLPPVEVVPVPATRRTLSELESKQVLSSVGVPVTRERLARTRQEAMAVAAEIGFPVACKGCGAAAAHKTELGVVHLGLGGQEEVGRAWDAITGRGLALDGVLVQEMVQGRRELVAGVVRDPHFGPCVMFGVGGVQVEVTRDVVFRVAPLEEADALEMLDQIRAAALLGPFRGEPAVDRAALARTLVALGDLALRDPGVVEVDVNPLVVRDGRAVAVDALVVLAGG